MEITLSVVSYHRLSPSQDAVKTFDTQGGILGRSPQCDWLLPDPERVLSGQHARIAFEGGRFVIHDLSTNGLFINRSVTALGRGNSHPLAEGDLLTLGDYEVEVSLGGGKAAAVGIPLAASLPPVEAPMLRTAPEPIPASAALGSAPEPWRVSLESPFDAPQPEPRPARVDAVHPVSPLEEHFTPPAMKIPDEWQWQFDNALTTQPSETAPPAGGARGELALMDDKPAVAVAPAPVHSEPLAHRDPLEAFIDGLGLSRDQIPVDADHRWWFTVGCAMQQMCEGLLSQLRERASHRSGMRVQQTTFQMRENNPLKFSASVDELFHNLFNRKGGSFVSAEQAVRDAFADLKDHEQALLAGVKGAVLGVLQQLDPQSLAARPIARHPLGPLAPGYRHRQRWELYRNLHRDLVQEVNQQANGGCNEDFVKAYEARLKRRPGAR